MIACGPNCQVEESALDSSYFANDSIGFIAYVHRLHREWCSPARLAEVARVRAAIAAMGPSITFACADCGKHAFAEPGVLCFWCRRGR